jgi:hypothetical protein
MTYPNLDADFDHVRDSERCALCGHEKQSGLLACWPCYRKFDMRNGLSPAVEKILRQAEQPDLKQVKSIVELIIELADVNDARMVERFKLTVLASPSAVRIDFDNWLRRCCDPRRQFTSLDDAWRAYDASFGVPL